MRALTTLSCTTLATLIFSSSMAVPVFDLSKTTEYLKKATDVSSLFKDLSGTYMNNTTSQVEGSGIYSSAFNNGVANMIVRNNQARFNNANQALAMSSAPVNVCGAYSLSNALNDLACQSLSQLSSNTQTYIKTSKNPYQVAHDASKHKITDISTIAVSTLPSVQSQDDVLKNADVLQEQAYKTSVSVFTDSIKNDKENLYNPLSNQAIDDFSDKAVKEIQESDNKSQIYRKMAVMQASYLTASMLSYKHELEKEMALSLQLLQAVKQQTQRVK